jgi:hypothetical protein
MEKQSRSNSSDRDLDKESRSAVDEVLRWIAGDELARKQLEEIAVELRAV